MLWNYVNGWRTFYLYKKYTINFQPIIWHLKTLRSMYFVKKINMILFSSFHYTMDGFSIVLELSYYILILFFLYQTSPCNLFHIGDSDPKIIGIS